MTVSPSCRQEHSAAAAENGSLRVSRKGDPSWLPISEDDDGSLCSRADFRKESGSAGGHGSVWTLLTPPCPPSRRGYFPVPPLPIPIKTPPDSTAFQRVPYPGLVGVSVTAGKRKGPSAGKQGGRFTAPKPNFPGPRAENTSWRGGGWTLPGNQILPELGPAFYARKLLPKLSVGTLAPNPASVIHSFIQ